MKEYRQTCLGPCGLLYQGQRKPKVTAWHGPRNPQGWHAGSKCHGEVVVEVREVGPWSQAACS